ncbi:hypothetical protein CTAYLR_007375 [Chrysophaeum taylorii]|uniref:Complex 1 LYR protein domain-containing protein n=1 Tax=Chrysophaeum taylorii TaxID=2483200 RepID=A0AAD7U5A0_9STRA|nr:hypothetical protein CTAYLR_007375 [Chrysophaeum taylorii]
MPPNREAIHLYRDILRASRLFHWCNEQGEPWNAVLRRNARKEFEEARYERDPLIVAKMLVVGRQCLDESMRKFDATQRKITERVESTRTR